MEKISVLIVGAGPTGLTFAAELARHGISFRIIDKKIRPVVTSNALATQTRTLEVWNDLGLIAKMLARGNIINKSNMVFGNKSVTISFSSIDSIYPFVLGISQHDVESILLDNLTQQNIFVEMEKELVELENVNESIVASIRDKSGQLEKIQADWLIACDGSHSFIREKLQIPFPGKELEEHFILADLKIDSDMSSHEVYGFFSNKGPLLFIRFDEQHFRLIAEVKKDSELSSAKTVTFEQLKRLVKERSPIPMKLSEPIWTSGFWIHERMINTYRCDRVFFAGDAAHIHSPAGGQGMNTGVQDAYNLAWKLSLIIKNEANPDILSTYQSERWPIAKSVLKTSSRMTRIVSTTNPILCWIRNNIFLLLFRSKTIVKKFAEHMTELSIHYSSSLLVQDCMATSKGPRPGMRMLDIKMNEEKYLMDHVRGKDFCLLIFTGTRKHEATVKLCHDRIKEKFPQINVVLIDAFSGNDIYKNAHLRYQVMDSCLYLIRPDKYIGFRGKIHDEDKLITFLQKIFTTRKT